MILLSVLGLWHSTRVKVETTAVPHKGTAQPVTVG